jgi:site-specific recombinase XerD
MDNMISTQNIQVIVTSEPLDQNPAAVYLAGLASTGCRSMKQSLDLVARLLTNGRDNAFSFQWAGLRFQHTSAIRSKLMLAKYKPATANRILSAIRSTLKAAWRLGMMTAEDYYRARDVQSITGEPLPTGRGLQFGELAALLTVCANDPTPAGARDTAIIALMYAAGLRREEVVNLDVESYTQETGRLVIFGKRSKERIGYLTNGAADAMADWLLIRAANLVHYSR